jgi:hypothetical protein
MPKREIQEEMSASAQDFEEMEERETASSHLVVRSMMVRMWVWPWEGGRGLTRSMWRWEKRLGGMGIGWGGGEM